MNGQNNNKYANTFVKNWEILKYFNKIINKLPKIQKNIVLQKNINYQTNIANWNGIATFSINPKDNSKNLSKMQ